MAPGVELIPLELAMPGGLIVRMITEMEWKGCC